MGLRPHSRPKVDALRPDAFCEGAAHRPFFMSFRSPSNAPRLDGAFVSAALSARWAGREQFTILETGFGAGDLFLATWAQWRREAGPAARLFYIALESRLLPEADLRAVHLQKAELEPLGLLLRQQWPLAVRGLHRLEFENARVVLLLGLGQMETILPQLQAEVDAFLLPDPAQRKLPGGQRPLRSLARLAAEGALFVADNLSPAESAELVRTGFALENTEATPGSPTLSTGVFRAAKRRRTGFSYGAEAREAVVIGAGLAGTAAAASLRKRGWEVTLLERHGAVAQEASGNLAGVMSPMVSRDDGLAARLSRASFLWLLRELEQFETSDSPAHWSGCGVLQFAKDPKEESLFQTIAEAQGFPADFFRAITQAEASADLGMVAPIGGCLFPLGGWVHPPSLCEARLRNFPGIRTVFYQNALEFHREENRWVVCNAAGTVLGSAPVLVLANAHDAARFELSAHLHFKKVRGQVTHLPSSLLPPFSRVLCRDGYLTPAVDGTCCLGATFDFDSNESALNAEGHLVNLARLGGLLPSASPIAEVAGCTGRVGFRALTADRMPLVGALPDSAGTASGNAGVQDFPRLPGLYGILGLGSRGLVWSALMGEFLAASIVGEPWPLEMDLARAIDPARFLFRAKNAPTERRAQK